MPPPPPPFRHLWTEIVLTWIILDFLQPNCILTKYTLWFSICEQIFLVQYIMIHYFFFPKKTMDLISRFCANFNIPTEWFKIMWNRFLFLIFKMKDHNFISYSWSTVTINKKKISEVQNFNHYSHLMLSKNQSKN